MPQFFLEPMAMRKAIFAAILLVSACGKPSDPTATASTEAPTPVASAAPAHASPAPAALSGRLDCLRQSGGVLLIGHRGGPTRDYPENAIETFARTFKAGTHGMEIDVVMSSDGVPYLMHDDTLERTSTGEGPTGSLPWSAIQTLALETYQTETAFHPPTLKAALDWAVANHAVLELDKKRATPYAPILAAVREAKAENNVFIITYTDDQAVEIHKTAPDLVVTATITSISQLDNLLRRGVKADHLVAWTGTERPDPALWKALADRGVESAFGTLGPRSTSLDGKYWADGDGSEYDALPADGLTILVTDITDKVARQLKAPMTRAAACGF
jgi:glycerophosphoryl diester phosphodiesterase